MNRILRNPVLIGTALVMLADFAESGDPVTWRTLILLVVGILVRSQVVPEREVLYVELGAVAPASAPGDDPGIL